MTPPTLPPARRSLTDHVTELFHEEIRSGRWAVGSRIPVETELVRWSGAGRNAVREAVQSLVQAGLVDRQQGRGTFVIARSQLTQSLHRRLSTSPRQEALELRFAIDGAAAALAAQRRTTDDIDALLELLRARTTAWNSADVDARVIADTALHRGIVAATHNELLAELYDGLLGIFESTLREDVIGEVDHHELHHRELVDAVVAGDPRQARDQIDALLLPLIADAMTRNEADDSEVHVV